MAARTMESVYTRTDATTPVTARRFGPAIKKTRVVKKRKKSRPKSPSPAAPPCRRTARQLTTPRNSSSFSNFNDDLGHPSAGGEAFWLSDDQIQQLATIHNPDRPHTSPSWLHGPAPINFWEKHFARTLVQPAQHGRVHIMVVNTEEQLTLDATASGLHWFVIAWFIEPKPDGAAAASGP